MYAGSSVPVVYVGWLYVSDKDNRRLSKYLQVKLAARIINHRISLMVNVSWFFW